MFENWSHCVHLYELKGHGYGFMNLAEYDQYPEKARDQNVTEAGGVIVAHVQAISARLSLVLR